MKPYLWQRIQDLPPEWGNLASGEVESLAALWQERRELLRGGDALKQFNERLAREWAIETGIIEGLYTIDRGTTQVLVERGIRESLIPHGATDKPASRIVAILEDHRLALEGVFDFIKRQRELSASYIKEIHAALTQNQPTTEAQDAFGRRVEVELRRGDWKLLPNNPTRPDGTIYEYCPPEHVAAEIDILVRMHREHETRGVPPEIEAAWLHHRFTQIHPFQDGNGRVARVLASLIFLRAGWFPLVVRRDVRADYIDALERADDGDLSALVQLFSGIQKEEFLRVLLISQEVADVPTGENGLQREIAAIRERLQTRRKAVRKELEVVFPIGDALTAITYERLTAVGAALEAELKAVNPEFWARASRNADNRNGAAYGAQIHQVARTLGYDADTRTYHSWARLTIKEDRLAELFVSFHGYGSEFLGLMAASAFLQFTELDDKGNNNGEVIPLNGEPFQFAYNETEVQVKNRFAAWLDGAILAGLENWRRRL